MSTCCTNPMYKCCTIDKEGKPTLIPNNDSKPPDYPFGKETFDRSFWQEVKDTKDSSNGEIDKRTAIRKVRVKRLDEGCQGDILIDLIKTKHDDYSYLCGTKDIKETTYDTFIYELCELAILILKHDFENEEPKYLELLHLPGNKWTTILHLAAERNLTAVMKVLLNKDKSLTYKTARPGKHLPLYYALKGNHDDAASMLIQHMRNDYVRDIFEDNSKSDYRFCDVITNGGMKKTVEAILDCLMSPDWPFFLLEGLEDDDGITRPNIPFRYHFNYRLLDDNGDYDDGDEKEQWSVEDGTVNSNSDTTKIKGLQSRSCLRLLADNSTSEDAIIRHPVVRMLMRSKWDKFGRFWIRMHLLLYVAFLSAMSIAFLTESSTPDRKVYSTPLDYLRLFCEIVTLLLTLVFIESEIEEVREKRIEYIYDPFNYFDVLGCLLILVVIPLRFTGWSSAEFGVSSAAYLTNFLRIGKTATAFKAMSIYLKTFGNIITKEITKFLGIFAIFMLSFAGAVYLALKASRSKLLNNNNGYWYIFLQEVRSVSESNGFGDTDQYTVMHIVVLILVLCNMFCCIVVLNNILIGQIGNTFNDAQMKATVQYDIDRTEMVTRIEAKSFGISKRSLRATNYVEGEFLTNELLEEYRLLEDWIELKKKRQDNSGRKKYFNAMVMEAYL